MERKRIEGVVTYIDSDMPLEALEIRIQLARKRAQEKDFINLRFHVGTGDEPDIEINGDRWETDADMEHRRLMEAAQEKRQREYYEQLKAKYEGVS